MIINVDGLDNIGKTTQIKLLKRFNTELFKIVEPLHKFDPAWDHIAPNDFSNWWFRDSSTDEFTDLICRSALKRISQYTPGNNVLLDRSILMNKLQCIATCAVKDNLKLSQASSIVEKKWRYSVRKSSESTNLLMLYSENVNESVEELLKREKEHVSRLYRAYQQNLCELLLDIKSDPYYDIVIYTKDKSILQVYNELVDRLNSCLSFELPNLFGNVKQIWGLSGLSEAGKSYTGEYLKRKFGFERRKISYFLMNAEEQGQIENIYGLDDSDIALELIYQLNLFCYYHSDVDYVSIESLHRYQLALELKMFFGDRLIILFLKAPIELRAQRAKASLSETLEKDKIKINRGCDRIENLADFTFENSKGKFFLHLCIDSLLCRSNLQQTLNTKSAFEFNFGNEELKTNIDKFIRSVDKSKFELICFTGSVGLNHWIDNWSDVDVLIVLKHNDLESCKRLFELFSNYSIKIGLTIYSRAEFSSLFNKFSIIQVKELLRRKLIVPLYVDEKFELSEIPSAMSFQEPSVELGIVIPTLRRLLICEPNHFRQIYKHIVLVMKIMLRLDKIDADEDEKIILTFSKSYCDIRMPARTEGADIHLLHDAARNLLDYINT